MIKAVNPRGGRGNGASTRYKPVAPAAGQGVLREAILARVFSHAPSIVVLQAPAGHGKSTVLRQIRDECEAHQVRCAWLNLDEADNDGRRHSTHLQRMLRQLFPDAPAALDAPAADRAHWQDRADWFVEILDRDDTPIALFVDEFEALSDRTVLAFWKDLLLKLPGHVQVFIATRASPEVGVPRLTVSDRILVLSSSDLCFSEGEVRSFFHLAGSEPTAAGDIRAIHRCTEGWPAAIQLFRLGLSRISPAEALKGLDQYRPRELADYLTECVLDGLSADTRGFLERTCILNRLGAQVCNALTGRSDSQQLLLRLEKQGLFVSAIDEGHAWFRYHSLFASQLREQLLTGDQARFRALHRQAAGWFHANAIHDDAMHHAVAADDLVFAADILESWSGRLVADGELSIAERWYDCLPLEEIRRRPLLLRRLAWALAFLRQRGKLEALIGMPPGDARLDADVPPEELPVRAIMSICADHMAQALDTISRVRIDQAPVDRFAAFELSAAANLDAYLNIVAGDFQQAELRLASARAVTQNGKASFSEGYTASVRGLLLLSKGQTGEAIELVQSALAAQRRALDVPFATAPLACCYLWLLYETNRIEEVLKTFTAYRDMVLSCAVPDLFVIGTLATARACRLLGRDDDALALLLEAEALAQQSRWPRIVESLQRERGLRSPTHEADGRSKAAGMAEPRRSWVTFEALFTDRHLEPIRAAIRQGRHEEAAAALAGAQALHPDCTLLKTRLGLCKALLLEARGLKHPAARQFSASLRLAFDSHYLRTMLDLGHSLGGLLDDYLDSTVGQAATPLRRFAAELQAALQPGAAAVKEEPTVSPDISQFSEREREIVECLSQRMSNREIARSAHISENTVKFHLKKIFAKLGVRRRMEAYSALIGMRRSSS